MNVNGEERYASAVHLPRAHFDLGNNNSDNNLTTRSF